MARQHLGVAANTQRRTYNRNTERPLFQPGDLVKMIDTHHSGEKLAKRFKGPYTIVEQAESYTFRIRDEATGVVKKVHANNLQRFHAVPIVDPATQVNGDGEQ